MTNFDELSTRAIDCVKWRWLAGMLTQEGHRVVLAATKNSVAGAAASSLDRFTVIMHHTRPDLRDAATLGCLLKLVRDAYGQPRIVLMPMSDDKWGVAIPSALRNPDRFRSDTEAEALVKALEEAPHEYRFE